jgi:hypothetical protein
MKRLLNKITDALADAALLGMGVDVQTTAEHRSNDCQYGDNDMCFV